MAAVFSLAAVLAPAANAQSAAEDGTSVQDIQARDQLISDQEALLNTYRCLFDIDTHIVPGGCADNAPAQPAPPPGPYQGAVNAAEVRARDQLISDQEALLNTYRCLFDIDTHIVPGGCAGPAQNTDDDSASDEPSRRPAPIIQNARGRCVYQADQTITCRILSSPDSRELVEVDAPEGQFTSVAGLWWDRWSWYYERPSIGSGVYCGSRADQTTVCWEWNGKWDDDGDWQWSLVELPSPAGPLTDIQWVAIDSEDADLRFELCGSRADQTTACWTWGGERDDDGNWQWSLVELPLPAGPLTDIQAALLPGPGTYFTGQCGSRADQTTACWIKGGNELPSPAEPLTDIQAVSSTPGFVGDGLCGSRADQTTACWTWGGERDDDGNWQWSLVELPSPAGPLTDIQAIGRRLCGSRADQTTACWTWGGERDDDGNWQWSLVELPLPAGPLTDIQVADDEWLCGSRADQTTACWTWGGERDDDGNWQWSLVELPLPAGPLTDIQVADDEWLCGSRADQTTACWTWGAEYNDDGDFVQWSLVELPLPAGPLTDIQAGLLASRPRDGLRWLCGSRADQTTACWTWGAEYNDDGDFVQWSLVELPLPAGPLTDIQVADDGWLCGSRADQTTACWIWDHVSYATGIELIELPL